MTDEPPHPPPPEPKPQKRIRIWLKWGSGFYDFIAVDGFNMAFFQQQVRGARGFLDDDNWIPIESILGVCTVLTADKPGATVTPFRPTLVPPDAPAA